MKKSLLYLASVLIVWMLGTQQVCAWTGNDVSQSTASAGTTSDDKTFVLYNVGTGKFMVNGGIWGTQAVLDEKLVTTFNVVSAGNSQYYLYTNIQTETSTAKRYMLYSSGSLTNGGLTDPGYFFLDQETTLYGSGTGNAKYTFEPISSGSTTYNIKVSASTGQSGYTGTFYLAAEETTSYGTVIGTQSSASDEKAQWQLVSVKDLKDNFSTVTGSATEPAAGSFMVSDPGFNRGDQTISKWYRGHSTTSSALLNNVLLTSDTDQSGTSISHYTLPSSAQATTDNHTVRTYSVTCYYYYVYYYEYSNNSHTFTVTTTDEELETGERTSNFITDGDKSDHHRGAVYKQKVSLTKTETTTEPQEGYQYYVGNGYADPGKDLTCVDEDNCSSHAYLQQEYGGYWTANIHGESGTIFQQVKITRAGIYRISCKGFTTDGTGYIFANVGNTQGSADDETYVTSNLTSIDAAPATYVKASQMLNSLGYSNVVVKVEGATENSPVTLTFGAFTTSGSTTSWTCVDDFTLEFYGKIVKDLLLDEDQTSIEYINAQVDANEGQTLYLHRTFTVGKWNSLVLPVSMTASQIETAFGEGTMLSTLDRTQNDGKQIIFEPATEIKAGQLYIIKPSKEITNTSKTVKITVNNEEKEFTIDNYYMCPRIQLNTELASSEVSGAVKESAEDSGIKHVGTYVKKTKTDDSDYAIPAKTYILSGGKWYYNTVGINTVKGFRGWIATNQSSANEAKSVVINGVEEELGGNTTAIEGIAADEPANQRMASGVYSINGQKISDGNSTEGLAKGVYIVGGKKVVVR